MATNDSDTTAVVRKQAEEARLMACRLHAIRLEQEADTYAEQLREIARCEAEALASAKQSPHEGAATMTFNGAPIPGQEWEKARCSRAAIEARASRSRMCSTRPMSFGESLATSPYLMSALSFAGGFVLGWLISL